MNEYEELKEYHKNKGKVFSDEFYQEMFEWNKARKKVEQDEAKKKTAITPNKVNAYGQKRKANGRWNTHG